MSRVLARVPRPGGEFRFATDWANYAGVVAAALSRARESAWTAQRADDWRGPWAASRRRATRPRRSAKGVCRAIWCSEGWRIANSE